VELTVIGHVSSTIVEPRAAALQGFEGAPECELVIDPAFVDGARDLAEGDELFVLTWLHRARRDVLAVHPRGDRNNPLTGVFSTRSAGRPNPIGLHRVTVVQVDPAGGDGVRLLVRDLEAVDGTPVIDVKPVLPGGR
jgi:tRNA-Thr(GGU) m(6)t(6)A37 methyltransferase TsaA